MSALQDDIGTLTDKLERETERVIELWCRNCEHVSTFDKAVTAKDAKIASLRASIAKLEASCVDPPTMPAPVHTSVLPRVSTLSHSTVTLPSPHPSGSDSQVGRAVVSTAPRRGKAPPVSEFSGDDLDCTLDDWLPSLGRAIIWNGWTEEEQIH